MALQPLRLSGNLITEADIDVELREDPPVDAAVDRVAGAAARRAVEVGHRRADRELEPVVEVSLRGVRERLADRDADTLVSGREALRVRHAQVEVARGAGRVTEAQLQRVPAFEEPR